jgi:phosphomannomutase
LLPDKIEEIELLIPDQIDGGFRNVDITSFEENGMLQWAPLEDDYCAHVENSFDLDAIRNSNLELGYDAMYGAGQNVIRRLLPDTTMLHCDYNPSFDGQAPEPIARNLQEFSDMIRLAGNIDCGLATDGDADRIGLFDNEGNFVDSHHIILLLIHYLKKYKGMDGKVCTAFSTSVKVKKLCDFYGLELETVKIGFKYIAGIMISEDVLLGGEESGGIAIKGHIPERDGIWVGLVLLEYMAKSGKTLRELINEIYAIVGPFAYDRADLHLSNEQKDKIVENCKNSSYQSFGSYAIARVEDLDGYKFYLDDNTWVMVRASGTEPVLRVYVQAPDMKAVNEVLDAAKSTLLN